MKINSINIKNYRGIENLQLEFKEGLNLLIGNNGAGKTSLLSAIAITLSNAFDFLASHNSQIEIEDDARIVTSVIGDSVVQSETQYPVCVESDISLNGHEFISDQIKTNESAGINKRNFDMPHYFKDSMGNSDVVLPLICFLQAGRSQAIAPNNKTVTITSEEPQRASAYAGAFTGKLNIEDIQKWCVQMEFAEYQRKREVKEYTAFRAIVSRFLSLIDEAADEPKIYYSSLAGSLVYFDGKDEKPLHHLSAGYQAVLCMIIELAYRAVILNPGLENIARETIGTVLIDEIEMHLHPAWQWKILEALRDTFPKIQFIVATHSPIIMSAARGSALYLMKSPNEVININNVYGYSINDVLTIPQESESQPEAVRMLYEKAEDIFDNGTEGDLDELLIQAENELADAPEVLGKFKEFIEVNKWIEEI